MRGNGQLQFHHRYRLQETGDSQRFKKLCSVEILDKAEWL